MKEILTSMLIAANLYFGSLAAQSPITVAETNFKLPILGEEIFYFGFAEGDQVIFFFEEQTGKDLKEVEILELPAVSRYKEFKTKKIQNKILTVPRTGIYQFRFANSVLMQKTCSLKIQRIPAGVSTQNFNTTVYWRTVYDTTYRNAQQQATTTESYKIVVLLPPTTYFLEPNMAGSKPQVALPINLPDFTAEWYYVYAVANSKQNAESLKSSFQLASTLKQKITERGDLTFASDSLPIPNGSGSCRVYLLDQSNHQLFETRGAFRHFKEGTRENTASGLVKIKTASFPNPYLGIRNPDPQAAIYVAVEAVAIIAPNEASQPAVQQSVSIKARKEAYLKN